MAACAAIVGLQAMRVLCARVVDGGTLLCIAACYAGFGLAAFVLRGRPHFLAFVLTGVLVALFAWCARSRAASSA